MARTGTRIHRLPQRLDYTLIPAPLDLSLPPASPHSPLPTVIITPADPTHDHDFSIAFLAPPPKLTLRQRLLTSVASMSPKLASPQLPQFNLPFDAELKRMSKTRMKQMFFCVVLVFIAICHVFTTRMLAGKPVAQLEFSSRTYSNHRAHGQLQLGLAAAAGAHAKNHLAHAHNIGHQALAVSRNGEDANTTDPKEKDVFEFLVVEDAEGNPLPAVVGETA